MEGRAILGQIIHCTNPYTLTVIDNGFVIIGQDGKVMFSSYYVVNQEQNNQND